MPTMKSAQTSPRLWLTIASLALLAGEGAAQVQHGDVLANIFRITNPSLEHLRADGTPVLTMTGTGSYWLGVVETASGLIATTSRDPSSVHLFDSSGAEVSVFNMPQIGWIPGDLDRFSDGTLAVVNQGGGAELYTEAGAHVMSFTHALFQHAFGCHVDNSDHLWLTDLGVLTDNAGMIFEFDRNGVIQQVISTAFDPGDLVVDPDGSLWVTDHASGDVMHLDGTGALLGSFPTGVSGGFEALALHPDGTLYAGGEQSNSLSRFSKLGAFLGDVPLTMNGTNGWLAFISIDDGDAIGVPYCFGDSWCPCLNTAAAGEGCLNGSGAGAVLSGMGALSVAQGSLAFGAAQLPPHQPALLFAADNMIAGGAGVSFGDGLRCAGGNVLRLGVVSSSATGDASWGPGLVAASGWVAGDVRRFQVWYRDPVGTQCGSAFNLSNGVEISFQN